MNDAVVPFWASGTKRTLSVSRSSNALAGVTGPTALQIEPPSVEYCQVPLPLTREVIAMPGGAPPSGSVTDAPSSAPTSTPGFATSSSVIGGSAGAVGSQDRSLIGGSLLLVPEEQERHDIRRTGARRHEARRQPGGCRPRARNVTFASFLITDNMMVSEWGSASSVIPFGLSPSAGPICSADQPPAALQVR